MKIYSVFFVVLIQALTYSPVAFSSTSNEKPSAIDRLEKILAYTEGQVTRLEGMKKAVAEASADSSPELKVDTCKILTSMLPAGSIEQLKQAGNYLSEHSVEMSENQKTRFELLKPKVDAISVDKPICG